VKVGIMQPYLFPYIGYFQLINAVDTFVIHDDVQYIKSGWINRNRFLLNGKEYLFTFSVKKNAFIQFINQRYYSDKFEMEKGKFLRVLKQAYSKAPFYSKIFSLTREILSHKDLNVSSLNLFGIKKFCEYLGISTPMVLSSELKKNCSLRNEARVIGINRVLKATHYINPVGGINLYSKELFSKNGLKLLFLKSSEIKYEQFNDAYLPGLSIVDVCMFNKIDDIQAFLNQYELKS
tara:strand:- start:4223 stop:4927 length:705 start_codon:yes stop_codon:yes gene_type:complete